MRFLNMMVPLPPPWNNATEVSSILIRSGALPAATLAAQQLYHCHTACAWIWTFWGRKTAPFRVPDSGPKIGPDEGYFVKDYYKGAGNWTRFWCRNPAPKSVPDSASDPDPETKPTLPQKGNPCPASLRPGYRLGGGACRSTHPTVLALL